MHQSFFLAQIEPGFYLAWWKPLPVLAVLWVWARLLTWIDKDTEGAHLHRQGVNSGMFAGLVLGLILFLALPGYGLAIAAFVVLFAIDIGVYLLLRHQRVGLGDLNDQLRSFFTRAPREAKAAAGDVQLFNKAGAPVGAPAAESPDAHQYSLVQRLLSEPLRKGCEMVDLVPADNAFVSRFARDGVTYNASSFSREDAATTVEYLKSLAALERTEKRKPQTGIFKVAFNGKKRETSLTTSGSSQGERAMLQFDLKSRYDLTLDQLGLAEDQLAQMIGLIEDPGGIVLLSAPPGQGLTTLFYATLRRHDAFLEHIQTIERDIAWDLEGVTQNKLPGGASPADEAKQVEWSCSQEPDVLGMTKLEDPRSAQTLVKFAGEGKRAYVCLRASSTFSALEHWRKLVGDDRVAMSQLRMIVNARLVRRLCMACKVQYSADPETLRKLNMSQDKAATLYQARTQPLRDQKGNPMVCEFCQDMRYNGRIGAYEMFGIDDEVRNVVISGGSTNQLKALFRKQRRKYMQERALAIVEAGETSVQEVLRALKTDQPSSTKNAERKV